jgi:hypothetical protein
MTIYWSAFSWSAWPRTAKWTQVTSLAEIPALLERHAELRVVLVDGILSALCLQPGAEVDGVLAVRALRTAGYEGPMVAMSADDKARSATARADPLGRTVESDKSLWRRHEMPDHVAQLLGLERRHVTRQSNSVAAEERAE